MHEIPMNEMSPDFAECWQSAGRHLQQQGQGAINWLRAHLHPPMLEHLSFRLGNQLFFVCLDAEGAPCSCRRVPGPRVRDAHEKDAKRLASGGAGMGTARHGHKTARQADGQTDDDA